MEGDKRQRKIAAGREKLAAFRKRKIKPEEKDNLNDSEQNSSLSSLSLSPLPLSDSVKKPASSAVKKQEHDSNSTSSSISENIEFSNSHSNSENDRSLQELLVRNIPTLDSPDLSQQNSVLHLETKPIASLQNSLISDSSIVSLNALEKFELDNNNILDEIINQHNFESHSESSLKSNPFDDLSSITLKSDRVTSYNKSSPHSSEVVLDCKRNAEEVMDNKEPIVNQHSTEIDSLKEVNSSNPSTLSTTEYKQYYDKINLGTIEFQDVLSHRDEHIKQLTDALQQVLEDRNNLQEQTEAFAQEIADLREHLVETTEIIKRNKWTEKKTEDSASTSLQSIPGIKSPKKLAVTKINFDFEDPELNQTMTPEEKKIVADMRNKINIYIQEKVEEYKHVYESELKVLRDRLEYEHNLNKKFVSSNKNTEDSVSSLPEHSVVSPKQDTSQKQDQYYQIDEVKFNETFTQDEQIIITDLRTKIYDFIQDTVLIYKNSHEIEIKVLKDRMESEKSVHDVEIERLRHLLNSVKSGSVDITELRQELNEKHNTEMEELRTYFENRCADIEKHYSEEIFSQQSRKMSGSSVSELDSEIFPHQLGPAGDALLIGDSPKRDLNSLQNKYHAELEILREDYDNRLDELKIGHEHHIQQLEQKYDIIIKSLKGDLEDVQKTTIATQGIPSSGEFEIVEVVESYERRLQEQVMLAKIDIVFALEQQIQTLVSSPSDNLHWPPELLQLRDRLTEHWNFEILDIKEQHAQEINKLKEEHEKQLSRALDRERRNSVKGEEVDSKKEKDNLKKVASNLRHLVAELLKYFTKCEDELNNTLVEELLKYGFDKDLSKIDSDLNDSSQSGSDNLNAVVCGVKRVHFTPDVSGLINIINDTSADVDNVSKDFSSEFRTELDLCLSRLKSEANAILALSSNVKPKSDIEESATKTSENKITSLTRQLITETQLKNDLNIQLEDNKGYVQGLEADKLSLETQLDEIVAKQVLLTSELNNAKEKINSLIESGRKEIVSEGYGENQITGSSTLGNRIVSLAELQHRARLFLAETQDSGHPWILLLEELCRESDKIMEDSKKDHEDLVQQIEAADKKLRATTKFLEDQAVDREQERDEAQREIASLLEQLRDGDRTRASCEQINKEDSGELKYCSTDVPAMARAVEHLEAQMREMSLMISASESRKGLVDTELKEAVDKIWVLRDIIKDLEVQIETKCETELELKNIVAQLEDKLHFETKHNDELNQKIASLKSFPDENHFETIRKLEAENQKLRVSSELVGPDGVLKQMKTQLNEVEKTLEKRTKDLESLHAVVTNTNCSSPSEDMSIRDQIRPSSSLDDNSDLPLEQLARLKDKLIRHARAEDAAMKRTRDLEMQLFTSKQDFEEMQSERDVLQDQITEQMVAISSLQLRLDEQRLKVESVQKQSNTSLEHRIYELENDIQSLRDSVRHRDNNNKELNTIVEQTKKRISELETQLSSAADIEKQMITQFQSEIKRLRTENENMKTKIQAEVVQVSNNDNSNAIELLDSLLQHKNSNIDELKSRLNDLESEVDFYKSLNLSKEQLLHMSNAQKSGDVLAMIEISEPDQLRRQEQTFDLSIHSTDNLEFKRNANETVFIGSTFRDSKYADKMHSPFVASEISTIEKIRPDELPIELESSGGDNTKSSNKHVHFVDHLEITQYNSKIAELQYEMEEMNKTLRNYEEELEKLKQKLQFSDETIKEQTEHFADEIDLLKDAEKNAKFQLAEAKMELQNNRMKVDELEKDTVRKDKMYMNLAKEKRELDVKNIELQSRMDELSQFEDMIKEKNKEIYVLEQQLTEVTDNGESESLKEQIFEKESEINHLKVKIGYLETKGNERADQLQKINVEYGKLQEELCVKNELLIKSEKEHKNIISQCDELSHHVANLKDMLDEKCLQIENMEKDLQREQGLRDKLSTYQKVIEELKNMKVECDHGEIFESQKSELLDKESQLIKNKSSIIELQKEIDHLSNYLLEKDKVIDQMTVDSNSLRIALESIRAKLKESGNVLDLKKRLREEQNLTSALHEELKFLKQSVEHYETVESSNAMETVVMLKESYEREKQTNEELKSTKDSLLLDLQKVKEKLQHEEAAVKQLKQLLDEEKVNSNTVQLQDANIIESMRVRLESLLEHENESENLLQVEKKAKEDLQKQLGSLIQKNKASSLETGLKPEPNYDITYLKMTVVQFQSENEILRSDLDTMKNLNSLVKTELKQARDQNENQKLELNNLKMLLSRVTGSETNEHNTGKKENTSFGTAEERHAMMMKVEELMEKVRSLREKEKEMSQILFLEKNKQMQSPVPEKFLNKMKELTSLLQGHINDNKQMTTTLDKLTDERKLLQLRVQELEERLQIKAPYDDPVARADHLFGRYLKSESYRKALVFQKRYLLTLLASYQKCNSLNLAELCFVVPKSPSLKGINKFRAAVFTIISIHRMKYIVQRWNTGRRIGASVIMKRPVTAYFQPRSNNVAHNSGDARSWIGNSPPSKERNPRRTEKVPLGDTIQESLTLAPLQAPALLTEYIERFDSIQQRLGLAIERSTT